MKQRNRPRAVLLRPLLMAKHLNRAMTLSSTASTSESLSPLMPRRSLSSMKREINSGDRRFRFTKCSNACQRAGKTESDKLANAYITYWTNQRCDAFQTRGRP